MIKVIALAVVAALAMSVPAAGQAAKLPDVPIKLVAGFVAGGSGDIFARLIGQHMERTLQRTIVIENKAGAGGRTASYDVSRATPDGTTLLVANISNGVLVPLTFSDAKYHPLKDFTPLGTGADFQIAFATGPMTGAKDLKSLLAWMKANPEKSVYAVPGLGSIPHLYGLQLDRAHALDMRMLQMRGGAPIANDLLAGQIPMGVAGTADFAELHRGDRIKIVAVSGTSRAPGFEDVPTFAEQGFPGFESNGWIAVFGPKGMAKDLQDLLADAIAKALRDPDVQARLIALGMIPKPGTPADLVAQIERDIVKWEPLIEAAGIKK